MAKFRTKLMQNAKKWCGILIRIIHVIKFLAVQNLALRGHREDLKLRESTNVGNFVGALTLLSHFDPLIKQHLENVEKKQE